MGDLFPLFVMTTEIDDLIALLRDTEDYRKQYGYNPHDNYAWREIMSFEYMRQFFPTIKKIKGRYGADGLCPELNLNWIEHKSVNASKLKKTGMYNFDRIFFELDVSESRFKYLNDIDCFIFALYDRDSYNHPYPVQVLMSYGEPLKELKEVIVEERNKFFQQGIRKRDTIEIYYPMFEHLTVKYGELEMPSTLLEFLV